MGKLLTAALPQAMGQNVDSQIFNRLSRILELSFNAYDTDATPSYHVPDRDEGKFDKGDVIWNLDEGVLQVWLGDYWENLSTPSTSGLSATGSVGTVQVIASGDITVAL